MGLNCAATMDEIEVVVLEMLRLVFEEMLTIAWLCDSIVVEY